MSIPITQREEHFLTGIGNERIPQGILVKGSFWAVIRINARIFLCEYEGEKFRLDQILASTFRISKAQTPAYVIDTDKIWFFGVTQNGDLNMYVIEPFGSETPSVQLVRTLLSNVIQVSPYVEAGMEPRLFVLFDTDPKTFRYYVYDDIINGVVQESSDLYWDTTRVGEFQSVVDELGSPLYNAYSAVGSPPNVFLEEYVPVIVSDFSGTPTLGAPPLSVTFTDLSTGYITSWLWDFGDTNTSTDQNPIHIYSSPGTYTVTLTASGPGSSDADIKTDYISVISPAPVADFTATPTDGYFPLVQFTDASISFLPIVQWLWDFGDGYSSEDQNPQHRFNVPGLYTVSLTVWNSLGTQDTESKTDFIHSRTFQLLVDFEGIPTAGPAPLTVQFKDKSEVPVGYSISGRTWYFGDGNTSNEINPKNTYLTHNRYSVSQNVKVVI